MKRLIVVSLLALTAVLAFVFFHHPSGSFFPRQGTPAPSPATLEDLVRDSDRLLQKNPDNLRALVDKGVAYYHMGPEHYADSLNALNAAWEKGAFDKRLFYYSGILHENLGLFDTAQKQYERFLRHEPGDREITLRLARLLFRWNKWPEAITAYQDLADKNPKDATSLINLGLARQKQYELESADKGKTRKPDAEIQATLDHGIENLEKAQAVDPNLAKGIYLALAKMYGAKGAWDKSAVSAQTELAKYPGEGDKDALLALAQAYEKMNDKPKLLETEEKLVEKDPQSSAHKRKVKALKSQLKIK